MTAPLLCLENLTLAFGDQPAVRDLSLTLNQGEILALIGPSGCGKTTTLRMIAGFEVPDRGRVILSGRDITALPPEARGIGFVFQDYALFPHMTVRDNILFGAGGGAGGGAAGLAALLAMTGLEGLERRFPDQLSGGQQQRVALARTFAARPGLILLDEPFSSLDAGLRQTTRREMRRLLRQSGQAVVLVTHDATEAMAFADRIAVMQDGRLHQCGPVRAVWDRPVDAVAARALGPANLISGVAGPGGCDTGLGPCRIADGVSGAVTICLRPDQIVIAPLPAHGPQPPVPGEIREVEFQGAATLYRIDCAGQMVDVASPLSFAPGQQVALSITPVRVFHPLHRA